MTTSTRRRTSTVRRRATRCGHALLFIFCSTGCDNGDGGAGTGMGTEPGSSIGVTPGAGEPTPTDAPPGSTESTSAQIDGAPAADDAVSSPAEAASGGPKPNAGATSTSGAGANSSDAAGPSAAAGGASAGMLDGADGGPDPIGNGVGGAGGVTGSADATDTTDAGHDSEAEPNAGAAAQFEVAAKPRVLVLTDISNEPDDEESLVRFLVYSNEYDVEGLIATTSTHLKSGTREDLIRRQLDAYESVRANLAVHAEGFPNADALRAVTATGQPEYGMAAVGQTTPGSELIIATVDAADERPLWVTAWGGTNTLAQALMDVRESRTAAELQQFVSRLRVYAISDQDDTGAWLRQTFPDLFYIVSPSDQTAGDYHQATWSGISGDEHYDNGPGYRMEMVSNAWLTEHVRTGHGALGELYPEWEYIMEGDTPSFLGLIDNGLGWTLSPSYGGWGGRYLPATPPGEPREIWTNTEDRFEYQPGTSETSAQATIWRFRPDFQNDFAARMDWCVASRFDQANHNPIPALNGDSSKRVMLLSAQPGATLTLSADGTSDPDADSVDIEWRIYAEAGTLGTGAQLSDRYGLTTDVVLPAAATGTLHVLITAHDAGDPPLAAYRRAIIQVAP